EKLKAKVPWRNAKIEFLPNNRARITGEDAKTLEEIEVQVIRNEEAWWRTLYRATVTLVEKTQKLNDIQVKIWEKKEPLKYDHYHAKITVTPKAVELGGTGNKFRGIVMEIETNDETRFLDLLELSRLLVMFYRKAR
ncbi:MAG: hypothetical protein ACK416_06690, partial [Zestosphaera sp.]